MPPTASSSSARHSSHGSTGLFARARLGDTGAFGELIARYLPGLRRWAHGRLHRAARSTIDTTDLVQDAALRTLPRVSQLELSSQHALAAYLREAVLNRIRDAHRKIARHGAADTLAESLVDARPSPLQHAVTTDLEAKYRKALGSLRPLDRELIVADVELGYSHAQLGHMINRSPNAARMALQRALERLAEQMLKE